jgi:hypothetical protein
LILSGDWRSCFRETAAGRNRRNPNGLRRLVVGG